MKSQKISRRTILDCALLATTASLSAAAPTSKRVLALIGDRYHNPDYIRVGLEKVFSSLGMKVDYTIQYDALSRDLLKNYQLLVILRDGMIWPNGYLGPDAYTGYAAHFENKKDFPEAKSVLWMNEEQGAAVKDFVNAGNGLYAMHNSSHISHSSKNYREVMGGAYIGHPTLRPFKVRVVNRDHPITQGIQEFVVNDEQHYVEYDKDRKHILMEADNIDGLDFEGRGTKSISAWAYDYGQGRVAFTGVGHTIHALWVPQYLELQKRAVRWLLKEI
ncbi:MAG TPA: ThuA domain-containing protein [Bryobacteraceae bacterium]|nr:ThuA domain-containing protein [Bryobacteraceae bacterium]